MIDGEAMAKSRWTKKRMLQEIALTAGADAAAKAQRLTQKKLWELLWVSMGKSYNISSGEMIDTWGLSAAKLEAWLEMERAKGAGTAREEGKP